MKTVGVYGIEMPDDLAKKTEDYRSHTMSMNVTAGCKLAGHACDSGITLQAWDGRTEICLVADSFAHLRWVVDGWSNMLADLEAKATQPEPAEELSPV